jgi:hypothetical protein
MGFFAALPIVIKIVTAAVPAIRTVERIFRGGKRGAEKREAAATEVVGSLKDTLESFEQYGEYKLDGIDRDDLQEILADPDALLNDVTSLNDAIVAFMKRLGVLEEKEDPAS